MSESNRLKFIELNLVMSLIFRSRFVYAVEVASITLNAPPDREKPACPLGVFGWDPMPIMQPFCSAVTAQHNLFLNPGPLAWLVPNAALSRSLPRDRRPRPPHAAFDAPSRPLTAVQGFKRLCRQAAADTPQQRRASPLRARGPGVSADPGVTPPAAGVRRLRFRPRRGTVAAAADLALSVAPAQNRRTARESGSQRHMLSTTSPPCCMARAQPIQ